MAKSPPADPARFEEAVQWFRARVPVTDAVYERLTEVAREYAFRVADAAQMSLVEEVFAALDKAVSDGTTLADFKKAVGEKLTKAWGKEQPYRLETIFRTNVQRAYSEGRRAQLTDPDTLEHRPFWQLSSLLDGRTSPICISLAGTVLPADDPFWETHQPPLHFSCRSAIRALTKNQAEEKGVTKVAPLNQPQEGFGRPGFDWEPDLSKVPEPLAEVYREKLEARAAAGS